MEKVKFNGGKLTVMQISDPQDIHWVRKSMLTMLNKACDIVNPDLIVFTGDNVLGNHLSDRRFGSKKRKLTLEQQHDILKTAIHHITDIPEKRGIPFSVIFGNHDDMNVFSKDEHADIYRECKMNRGLENTGKLCGTYRLPIYSSDGKSKIFDIYMIDTAYHDKFKNKCFEEVRPEAVEWFKKEATENKEPAMMFMHIPFKELSEFVIKDENGMVTGLKNGCFGTAGEHVSALENDNGLYNAVKTLSDVKLIVSGHDHTNSFTGVKDNIVFAATPTASFRCYGGKTRGVRVFEISENDTESIKTYTLTLEDILGKNIITSLRYFWDADDMENVKYKALASTAAAAITAGSAAAFKIAAKLKGR